MSSEIEELESEIEELETELNDLKQDYVRVVGAQQVRIHELSQELRKYKSLGFIYLMIGIVLGGVIF